jgi:hypothetical protein
LYLRGPGIRNRKKAPGFAAARFPGVDRAFGEAGELPAAALFFVERLLEEIEPPA